MHVRQHFEDSSGVRTSSHCGCNLYVTEASPAVGWRRMHPIRFNTWSESLKLSGSGTPLQVDGGRMSYYDTLPWYTRYVLCINLGLRREGSIGRHFPPAMTHIRGHIHKRKRKADGLGLIYQTRPLAVMQMWVLPGIREGPKKERN